MNDNEHMRLLQTAITNSRVDNVNTDDLPIAEAPVYYPTVDEFRDPIAYVQRITPEASKFGICRIVPPEGWANPTQFDFASPRRFPTKLQRMNLMQEGRSMADGQFYNAREYKVMADGFKAAWMARRGTTADADLESDYWKLIKCADRQDVSVEYANDLSTSEYGSGFPVRRPDDVPLEAGADLAQHPPFGSDEYYRTCGWNLNNIASWPGSALRHVTHSIDGINRPWLYLGMLFSSFCWHREDIYLASMNYLHEGAPKQWYGIPGAKAGKFSSTMEKQLKLRIREVPDLEHHITTQISPGVLINSGVPVFKTKQEPGNFIITFPQAYHAGFSYGFNCGEAVNFATPDWINHGAQSVVDYRLKGKREVFSFDRLLFTLAYHLDELAASTCAVLAKQVETLMLDEEHFRRLLYGTGVQNVMDVMIARIDVPPEGKMSPAIDETLAQYDDQRVCYHCQHTCFLSAVCCNCSDQAVSCLRCCDALCGCPRDNKFILEWHSIEDIAHVLSQIRAYENHLRLARRAAAAEVGN